MKAHQKKKRLFHKGRGLFCCTTAATIRKEARLHNKNTYTDSNYTGRAFLFGCAFVGLVYIQIHNRSRVNARLEKNTASPRALVLPRCLHVSPCILMESSACQCYFERSYLNSILNGFQRTRCGNTIGVQKVRVKRTDCGGTRCTLMRCRSGPSYHLGRIWTAPLAVLRQHMPHFSRKP